MTHSLIAADNQRAIEVKTKAILAHIDGEPARTAAAREEQRASDAEQLARIWYGLPNAGRADHGPVAVVRSTPLTATPLADALRLANENIVKMAQASTEAQASAAEGVRYWTDLAQAEARDAAALRARVAELERDSAAMTATANAEVAAGLAMAAERDALRAQVEALWRVRDMLQTALRDNSAAHSETGKALLRAEAQVGAARTYARQALDYGEDCDATDLLAAMDEAKP